MHSGERSPPRPTDHSPPRSDHSSSGIDPRLINRLLARIEDLESRVSTIDQPTVEKHHQPSNVGMPPPPHQLQRETSDTMSVLSNPTSIATDTITANTAFTSDNVDNVSMAYRLLTPPSSITGYTNSTNLHHASYANPPLTSKSSGSSRDSIPRNVISTSPLPASIIEALSSKIETNHEHLTRLDHVVSLQEETIRRQHETIQALLRQPNLVSTAPFIITRFFKSIFRRSRVAKALAASKLREASASKVQRFWQQRKEKPIVSVRNRAILLQKAFRGPAVRRVTKFRTLYYTYTALAAKLERAEEIIDDNATICPITKETVVDPTVCIADGYTYERSAIATWVAKNKTSPLTREPCSMDDLVQPEELVSSLRAMKIQATAGIQFRKEKEELREVVARGEAVFELVSQKNDELQSLLDTTTADVDKLKAECLRWKQETLMAIAAKDHAEAEAKELAKRLSSTSRRAKSVQFERNEFHVELARINTEKDILAEKVNEHKVLHRSLLEEMKSRGGRGVTGCKGIELATQLRMSVGDLRGGGATDFSGVVPCRTRCADVEIVVAGPTPQDTPENYESDQDEDYSDTEEYISDDEVVEEREKAANFFVSVNGVKLSKQEEAEQEMKPTKGFTLGKLREIVLKKECGEHGVDRAKVEEVLQDEDFELSFKINREQFQKLPAWRRIEMKKQLGLF
jgi:hypothetical protein